MIADPLPNRHNRVTPKRFAAIYAIWSLLWVLGSDFVLHVLIHGPNVAWKVQSYKGIIYVLVSGLIIFLAVRERDRRHRAERASTESMLRSLRQSGLVGIYEWDAQGRIIDANNMSLAALGYTREELSDGKLTRERLTPPEYWEADRIASQQVAAYGHCALYEKQVICKDGRRLDVLVGRSLLEGSDGGIGYALDITELKSTRKDKENLEKQLAQVEKLNALGQLTAGIAHDFNNLLSVIIGYASVAESQSNRPLSESVTQVLHAAEKARNLVRKLLAFGRKQLLNPEIVNVNELISELHGILSRLIDERIELVLRLGQDVGAIEADPSQIEQVILNLVINARDAMPNGGTLTIETLSTASPPGFRPSDKASSFVVIRVTDSGMGIGPDVLPHIFEPFFTTKQEVGGTGLGLATVYGIVKQTGGNIDVESVPGQGSVFTVTVPRVRTAAAVIGQPLRRELRGLTGTETILLVEDLDELREMMSMILQSKGYHVLQAGDGEDAVQTARSFKQKIDLVIADVVMPHLNGPDAIQQIRQHRPHVKVIFITGYAEQSLIERVIPSSEILEKPLRPDTLLAKVRALLDDDSRSAVHVA
jgi:PAS domain S-box-containing protein